MDSKKVSNSKTIVSQLMVPNDTNFFGYVHGGVILQLIDRVAYACAVRHSEIPCITAGIDKVNFYHSIKIGDLVTLKASVNYVGNTSMEIGIRVESENLKTREINHNTSSFVTMIGVDENMNPKKVPGLILETDEEKRRYKDAKKRKEQRKN